MLNAADKYLTIIIIITNGRNRLITIKHHQRRNDYAVVRLLTDMIRQDVHRNSLINAEIIQCKLMTLPRFLLLK